MKNYLTQGNTSRAKKVSEESIRKLGKKRGNAQKRYT